MNAAPPPAIHTDTAGGGAAPGPGRLLRAARERAGIGLRDVAAQMHLDERTMTALENDAFTELPAPTFVRGYLRGYARLLGVPVGPVMEAYDREGFTPPDLVADIAEKPQANSGDFPVRMTTYVVVVVLTVLVVLWWHNQGFDEPVALAPAPQIAAADSAPATRPLDPVAAPPAALAPRAPEAPTAEAATASDAPSRPRDASPVISPVMPSTAATTGAVRPDGAPPATESSAGVERRVEQVLSQAERVLERTRGEIDAATRSPPPVLERAGQSLRDTAATPPPVGGASGSETAASAPQQSARPAAPATAAGMARLRLRFPEQAWVEIYDRNEQRLFYNLASPGRELDLQGEPPIRVLLGRTRGVSVEYNGQAVDIAPHTERGVARFTLGQ